MNNDYIIVEDTIDKPEEIIFITEHEDLNKYGDNYLVTTRDYKLLQKIKSLEDPKLKRQIEMLIKEKL